MGWCLYGVLGAFQLNMLLTKTRLDSTHPIHIQNVRNVIIVYSLIYTPLLTWVINEKKWKFQGKSREKKNCYMGCEKDERWKQWKTLMFQVHWIYQIDGISLTPKNDDRISDLHHVPYNSFHWDFIVVSLFPFPFFLVKDERKWK